MDTGMKAESIVAPQEREVREIVEEANRLREIVGDKNEQIAKLTDLFKSCHSQVCAKECTSS